MNDISILDCTLRDGGRIIDCAFQDDEIRDIAGRLADAKVDIIEVGFLRDYHTVHYAGNSTFFTDVEQIIPFIDKSLGGMYVAFVDYGMFDFDSLKEYDGRSIDGIRVGFTKKNFNESLDDIVRCLKIVKERGYKLFIQGVNSLSYTDRELLELIHLVNTVKPYCFGIVDTYGAMYADDVARIYGLIDHNMDKEICIDFHSHNNYQLSFSLAQEVIKLGKGVRNIIIDSTLNGMGKVAGNLNTELIIDYLVRKFNYNYDFDRILDIIDDYIYPYKKNEFWGYSIPALMAGIYQSHPNNILYLTEKFRMPTKDIKNLLAMIEPYKRTRYDYDNIEKLYLEYNASKVEDNRVIEALRKEFAQKEILLLVPGSSLTQKRDEIAAYIKENNPVCISVNFVSDYCDYAFWGNAKRYVNCKKARKSVHNIITSNIVSDNEEDVIVNYYSLINREYKNFENSSIMLLNLLKRIGVSRITIAGFDGFDAQNKNNYYDNTFQNYRHIDEFALLNSELYDMLEKYYLTMKKNCKITMITPSLFSNAINQ